MLDWFYGLLTRCQTLPKGPAVKGHLLAKERGINRHLSWRKIFEELCQTSVAGLKRLSATNKILNKIRRKSRGYIQANADEGTTWPAVCRATLSIGFLSIGHSCSCSHTRMRSESLRFVARGHTFGAILLRPRGPWRIHDKRDVQSHDKRWPALLLGCSSHRRLDDCGRVDLCSS